MTDQATPQAPASPDPSVDQSHLARTDWSHLVSGWEGALMERQAGLP